MHCATMPTRKFMEMKQIQDVVAIMTEARLAIVSALNDVHGNAGQDKAALSGHDQ
jgi:hypothetical protein